MGTLDGIDGFTDRVTALEEALGAASGSAAAFQGELQRMQATTIDTGRDVGALTGGLSRGLRRAFDGLVFDGNKLSDALSTVGKAMVDTAYSAAIKPVANHLGGLLAQGVAGLMNGGAFAKGASFLEGRVMPFASGGIVTAPTTFPMRGGTGLMGEAGPEAIMPLARGPDGRLGVKTDGRASRPVTVVMNITTPDVKGFRRSQSQVASEMSRALARGNRNR